MLPVRSPAGALTTKLMNSRPRPSGCAAKMTLCAGLRSSSSRISRTRSFAIVLGRKKSLKTPFVVISRWPGQTASRADGTPPDSRRLDQFQHCRLPLYVARGSTVQIASFRNRLMCS